MRITRSPAVLLACCSALAAADSSSSVSLVDFKPRVLNLPSACEAVYTEPINGCIAVDFQGSQCSVGCVEALQALVPAVQRACGNSGVTGENIIVAFLANSGPQSVCPNAQVVLSQVGTTVLSTPATTTAAPSTLPSVTSAPASTILSGVETVSSLVASSAAVSAAASSSPVLSVDTSGSPSTLLPSSTLSSPGSSQTGMGDPSGGGSPFDTDGNMNSAAGSIAWPTASMTITALLALWLGLR